MRRSANETGTASSIRRRVAQWMWIGLALGALTPALALAAETATAESTAIAAVTPAPPAVQASPVLPGTVPRAGEVEGLENIRPRDFTGLNVFEPPKATGPYAGKKVYWGFGFVQQFQGVHHSNTASPNIVIVNGQPVNTNQLITIGNGFNNADANLNLDAVIARGVRVSLTSYLSSRHHNETCVKDGYLLVDDSLWDNDKLESIMKVATLKIGHFEVNYGDQHFRRSDNGNTLYNPFVGNLIMDAFTTEIGAEVYARKSGFLAMAGVTGGEIRGQVQKPAERSATWLGQLGYDRQIDPALRVRVSGSVYHNPQSANNTLYSGNRAGARYYSVLENTQSTESAQAWSGDLQPGFRNQVTAWVVNPFVKFHDLELFGNIEQAKGRASTEPADRTWNQYAGDAVYRFLGDKLYVAGRYNTAEGRLAGMSSDVRIERMEGAGGWFLTPNVLAKVELVRQNYKDFPATDIRNGGKFEGFMVEGAITF